MWYESSYLLQYHSHEACSHDGEGELLAALQSGIDSPVYVLNRAEYRLRVQTCLLFCHRHHRHILLNHETTGYFALM